MRTGLRQLIFQAVPRVAEQASALYLGGCGFRSQLCHQLLCLHDLVPWRCPCAEVRSQGTVFNADTQQKVVLDVSLPFSVLSLCSGLQADRQRLSSKEQGQAWWPQSLSQSPSVDRAQKHGCDPVPNLAQVSPGKVLHFHWLSFPSPGKRDLAWNILKGWRWGSIDRFVQHVQRSGFHLQY